jgi:hypothetical protein
MLCEQIPAFGESDRAFDLFRDFPVDAHELNESFEHRVEVRQNMRLGPAQRRKSRKGELLLQGAQIVLPHSKIVQKISCAIMVIGMNRVEFPRRARL